MSKKKENKVPLLDDPLRLAQMFLCDYVWCDNEDNPKEKYFTLGRYKEELFIWQDGCYHKRADDTLKQNVTSYLQEYSKDVLYRDKISIKVTSHLVNNTITNIQPIIHVGETQQINTFLDGVDRGRFLSMGNGLLNLDSRQLIDHTPNFFNLVKLPYNYNKNAECPEWDLFLGDVMLGRCDYIELLQEFIGYLFRPDLREQKFLLCVGEGANGKGVLFDVIQSLVGKENCSQVPISQFGDRFALYSTIGKVANFTNESSHILEDEAENVLKSYVAGDPLTIDRKFREPVSVTPTAKLLIATNNLPRFNDKSQAVWRRILLVPFDLTLDQKYQIKDKADQLKQELPGILNWALQGLDRLNSKGFTIPAGNAEIMEQYRRDADPARAFLMDSYQESLNGTYVPCAEIYKAYRLYCDTNGCHAMNERTFGQHVKRLFPRIQRHYRGPRGNREYVYEGLCSI